MSESNLANDDISNLSPSDKSMTDFDPDFVEERFRVDRRKLEELIRADENGVCADEFFCKIMRESDVYIAWPSKLKIGAKSKKDPYVKVSGKKEAVSQAKNRILENLTTKSLRVTLKMNVSHTEHSHVIGKGGNNIKKVMVETACHIHFPDSNRNNNNTAEKSSQVSVAGLFPAVEIARMKIRDLLPLAFAFDVPVLCPSQLNVELLSLVENVQQKYGVSVSVKPHALQSYLMSVFVRTSVHNADSARKAADTIFEHLTGRSGVAYGVSLMMDLSTQHHTAIMSGTSLNHVMQWTGTTIHIPDQFINNHVTSTTYVPLNAVGGCQMVGKRKNVLYINGTMPNVFVARQHLLDCLPVVLMFDCEEETVINPGEITKLSEELEVQVVVKLKPKHPSKSVIIKTIERNVEKLYDARRQILNLDGEEDTSYKVSKTFPVAGYLKQCPYKLGGNDGVVVLPTNPTRSPHPASTYPFSHSSVVQPVVVLPAGLHQSTQEMFNTSCQHPPTIYYSSSSHLSSSSQLMHSPVVSHVPVDVCNHFNEVGTKASQPEYNSDVRYMTCNGYASNLSPQTTHMISPSLPLKTASVSVKDHLFHKDHLDTSSMTTTAAFSLSNGLNQNEMNHRGQPEDQHKEQMFNNFDALARIMGTHHTNQLSPSHSPYQNSIFFGGSSDLSSSMRNNERDTGQNEDFNSSKSAELFKNINYGQLITLNNDITNERGFAKEGDLESSSSSSQGSSLNHSTSSMGSTGSNKAPGSNRPKKSVNPFKNVEQQDTLADDYIKLKNLANQAMQKKPDGECRFPTDCWSGFGFSKSMPQSAIAEKLNQFNQLRYEGPSVPTQYEITDEDGDGAWPNGFGGATEDDFSKSKTIISLVNQLSLSQRELFGSSDSLRGSSTPQWSEHEQLSDLDPLFNEIGLSKYINVFKQQEVDMATFLTLTDQDLKDLGINTFGARRKMLLAIADLNQKQAVLPPPPGLFHPFRDPNFLKRKDINSHSIRW